MGSGQFFPRNLKDLSEKYDIIQDQQNTVANTKNSLLETMKTSHNPIYFNYYGATLKLGTTEDPKKQAKILYSFNGSSSDEGSYDKESGKFVAKQGNYRLTNTSIYI